MIKATIIVGLIAAVLSQYAWLLPISQAYLVFCLVALLCAIIAGILTLSEWLGGRS